MASKGISTYNLEDLTQKFYNKTVKIDNPVPLYAMVDLTYRCNLNCVHCYCKGSEGKSEELNTSGWKSILNKLHKAGCLMLTFTGGEPLFREDFLEIYLYAKKLGFITNIFSNGCLIDKKIFNYLLKYPPYCIEITLNGIHKRIYESITRVEGSFHKIMSAIRLLSSSNLRVVFKSNCLTLNKHEIKDIYIFLKKRFNNNSQFKYSSIVLPRINGDKTPCKYRISYEEMNNISKSNPEFYSSHKSNFCAGPLKLNRDKKFLYQCNSWMDSFYINPFGFLKFCEFSNKFTTDLKENDLRQAFIKNFNCISKQLFNKNFSCRDCKMRTHCGWCPSYAFLETGSEESPIKFFCKFTQSKLTNEANQFENQ